MTTKRGKGQGFRIRPGAIALGLVLLLQAGATFFFLSDILVNILGIRTTPIAWQMRELLEIGAGLGLLTGFVLGAFLLRHAVTRSRRAEDALRAASGAFMEVLEERFGEWSLTRAERDVALFSIKGLSLSEIAAMRNTSEGTVKAQTNAIYRKAGVSGRPQLLSLFIDELMDPDGPTN